MVDIMKYHFYLTLFVHLVIHWNHFLKKIIIQSLVKCYPVEWYGNIFFYQKYFTKTL